MSKSIMSKQKFFNQWLRQFAKGVRENDLNLYVKDQYIWHVFSWDLINKESFLTGDAARMAYDAEDKSDCIFCDMFGSNGVTDKLLDEYASADSIDSSVTELYVVAKDYSWTYIKTHECDLCGPYFMRLP